MCRRLVLLLLLLGGLFAGCSGPAGPDGASSAGRETAPGATVAPATPGPGGLGSTAVTPTGKASSTTTAPAVARVLPSGRPGPPVPAEERAVTLDLFAAPADIDLALVGQHLAFAAAQGANTVYVTASEADLVNLTRLTSTLDQAHDLGLVVVLDPFIGGTFRHDAGGSAAAIVGPHPDWQAVSRRGVVVPVPAINSAAYREVVLETLGRFLAFDIDGVVLDQPSFPLLPLADAGDYFPFDPDAQLQFESRFGHVLPPTETAEVVQFRHDSMKSFLEDLAIEVKHKRPDVTTRLLLPADGPVIDTRAGTDDWDDLASIQGLDALQIEMPAGAGDDVFAAFVRNQDVLLAAIGSRQSAGIWISASSLGDGSYAFISAQIADARQHGVTQFVATISDQRPNAQPDAAWAEIRKAFGAPAGEPIPPPAPLSTTTTAAPTPPGP